MIGNALKIPYIWLFILLAPTQVSCAPQCAADCFDSARVSFEPPIPEPGNYRISVATSSGGYFTCTLTIPALVGDPETDCGAVSMVRKNGQFVEAAGFSVIGTPSQIDVLIEEDGEVLADEALTPEYRDYSVCGSDCLSGSASLAIRDGA